ncbi:MAG TPA: hypothetical protein VGF80_06380 [Galbitalea sp.]|jgi:hypothetical protein
MTDSAPSSTPIDPSTISNAVLFCQDSVAQLAAARKLLNPITLDPTLRHIVDSIEQLQNSMLDMLNWASQVDVRLSESTK